MSYASNNHRISGKGLIIACLILFGCEIYLHYDGFLHRYRSVFAVGRAADKIDYVIENRPRLVLVGNSRVDNAIDPALLTEYLDLKRDNAFNLGVPGVNTIALSGITDLLLASAYYSDSEDVFVLLGLDESLFTLKDELNYSVFFANRWKLLKYSEFRLFISTVFRLWGFSDNLKGLREPGRFQDFLQATLSDRESWGGPISQNLGFRAQNGELSAKDSAGSIAVYPTAALDPVATDFFYNLIDSLLEKQVNIAVFFAPLFGRESLFEKRSGNDQYQAVINFLRDRQVAILSTTMGLDFTHKDFLDAGHLNVIGAKKFTASLAESIFAIWPDLGKGS